MRCLDVGGRVEVEINRRGGEFRRTSLRFFSSATLPLPTNLNYITFNQELHICLRCELKFHDVHCYTCIYCICCNSELSTNMCL